MELINSTGFPADFLSGSMGDSEMLGIVACKITYSLDREILIPVDPEQSWPIFDKPFVFKEISLAPELDYRKKGIDIIVFGKAVALNCEPVKRMRVAVECGNVSYKIEVFGDRIWRMSNGELVASEPIPFLEMDLSNNRVYGGTAMWEDSELTHSVNPDGRGFYMSKTQAEGQPLPNLERPDSLILKLGDQPRPACMFKPKGMYFNEEKISEDPQELMVPLIETVFNQTVPELVVNSEDIGPDVRLSGFCATGDIIFPTPPSTGPKAIVTVGSLHSRFPSTLSSLIILADEQVLIAGYLCLFRYLFRARETRRVKLEWLDDPIVRPLTGPGDRHG